MRKEERRLTDSNDEELWSQLEDIQQNSRPLIIGLIHEPYASRQALAIRFGYSDATVLSYLQKAYGPLGIHTKRYSELQKKAQSLSLLFRRAPQRALDYIRFAAGRNPSLESLRLAQELVNLSLNQSASSGPSDAPISERSGLEVSGLRDKTVFDLVEAGRFRAPAEEEWDYTIRSVGKCVHSLRAISYQEEDWWLSSYGELYLDQHKEPLARGVSIQRIFIARGYPGEPIFERLRPIMDRQAQMGIDVWFVYEEQVAVSYLTFTQDVILYDRTILRTSPTATPTRELILQTDWDSINRVSLWFDSLEKLGTKWEAPV
jgi:hypothetical protein